MDFETCYVFSPGQEDTEATPPAKRRRIGERRGLQSSWPRRRALYDKLWSEHQAKLQHALDELNEQTVKDVSTFIIDTTFDTADSKLDSAILVTGPSLTSQGIITRQVHAHLKDRARSCFVSFKSSEAANLKAVLKRINAVTSSVEVSYDDETDEQVSGSRKGLKLLNYDLRISQQAVEDQNLGKVVIAFQDCEAFDGAVLSDVIELLSCWKDRIPFVLMFGVATSIEALQSKLSRRAIRCLRGRRFDATNAEATLEKVFSNVYSSGSNLWFGSGMSSLVLSRQRDYLANPQSIIDSIQYGYMSHFYANAVSLFLDDQLVATDVPKNHFEAARNLPSFMQLAETLLEQGKDQAGEVRELLKSDSYLYQRLQQDLKLGQQAVRDIIKTARVYQQLASGLEGVERLPESEIVVQALSGSLLGSARLKTFFLVLKRATSKMLQDLLDNASDDQDEMARDLFDNHRQRLVDLLKDHTEADGPLRSEVDIQNSTLRTTVISKKISLSKAKTTLTKADAAYSEILNDFIERLQNHFSEKLIDPKTLPFNEIFLFDLKSPYRQTFTPRPRHAIERALSSPHDYLNCECCVPNAGEGDESTLASTQHATAILYQLYLESGLMANAADLSSAFAAILGEKVEDEEVLNALFQRSLAELSYLALVKGTKKKADHLIKTAWKGL
ncbi:hypothetical protein KVT40_008504 [Elsinoe batatas]|uniref:Origin recognition complex subunit 3 n=1 Tax=Elsinoe batatas TaxID=2601811 RepID=A0A8K0L0E9_9PEZI|nr:hypothetical protein KVT40_008504 [Elsinoe batatas]